MKGIVYRLWYYDRVCCNTDRAVLGMRERVHDLFLTHVVVRLRSWFGSV